MKLLVKSGERVELVSPSDWFTAKNRRLQDLEFFNRIGHKQPFAFVPVFGAFLSRLPQLRRE
jgi:hypothetical protein